MEEDKNKGWLIFIGIGTAFFFLLFLFVISSAYAYFNSGASQKDIFLEAEKGISDHTPKFNWIDNGNEGRVMENYAKKRIMEDYSNAWYYQNIAHHEKWSENAAMFFTEEKIEYFNNIGKKKSNVRIERTDLEHNIDFHLYSLDGQIVSFTDSSVYIVEKIKEKNGKFEFVKKYKATYDVVMIYRDDNWKVRHMVPRGFQDVSEQALSLKPAKSNMPIHSVKGMNYYPQYSPWKMWAEFSADTIRKDFDIINSLGLNTVRIFIPFEIYGKGHVSQVHLDNLDTLINIARQNKLQVIPTLFDFVNNYHLSNWAASDRQLESIIEKIKHYPNILAWDIKNEPDLDFKNHGEKDVKHWLEFIIERTRMYDPERPVTIGWSSPEVAFNFQEELDFITFHFYRPAKELNYAIDLLRIKCPNKDFMLGEFGMSSYNSFWFPFGKTKKEQRKYYEDIFDVLQEQGGISYLAWTLYDFQDIPSKVVGILPWHKSPQKSYGVINQEGMEKPVAEIIGGNKFEKTRITLFDRILKPFNLFILSLFFICGIIFLWTRKKYSKKEEPIHNMTVKQQ